MGRFPYLFLLCLICCPFVVEGIVKNASNGCSRTRTTTTTATTTTTIPKSSKARIFKTSMDNFVDKLFEETDTNEDGMVSFEEAYVGCLLLYVRLNRRAPIPPPSREKFQRIFLKATGRCHESNGMNLLDKEEYGEILKRIVARAMLRLTSHKVVTLIGAPLLAEMMVRSLAAHKEGFEQIMRFLVPDNLHESLMPTLTSKAFHRGFWMVILVVTLGNTCLAAVTFLLDLGLPKTMSED